MTALVPRPSAELSTDRHADGGYRCACGDVWPDASYGCGHTPTRCEGGEGYGLFDPYAFTSDSVTRARDAGEQDD